VTLSADLTLKTGTNTVRFPEQLSGFCSFQRNINRKKSGGFFSPCAAGTIFDQNYEKTGNVKFLMKSLVYILIIQKKSEKYTIYNFIVMLF